MGKKVNQKLVEALTINCLKEQNLSDEQIKDFTQMLTDSLNRPKVKKSDKIEEKIAQSFFEVDGELHSNILELINEIDCIDQLEKYLYKELKDDELRLYIDGDMAVFVCKVKRKLILHFLEKNENYYDLDLDDLFFIKPKTGSLKDKDYDRLKQIIKSSKYSYDIKLNGPKDLTCL